jgi:signal transduction histidine kinase/ActR/RegA family two-component response regulator
MPMAPEQLPRIRQGLITFALYTLAGVVSLALADTNASVSLMYIAAGFGLACVLAWGRVMAIPVGLGSALVSLLGYLLTDKDGISWAVWVGFAANGLGGGLQAWAAARWAHPDEDQPLLLDHPRAVATFLLICGPLACTINAGLSSTVMALVGTLSWSEWLPTLASWWAGDTLGVLMGTPLLLTALAKPRALWRRRRLVLGLTMLVATLLLGLGIRQVQSWEHEREAAAFKQEVDATTNAVRLRLQGYMAALESLRGVYEASDTVERDEFRRAGKHWLQQLKGIQALGWDERLHINRLKEFEEAQQREGLTNYRVFDLPSRKPPQGPDVVALRFIEPMEGNERALGYNVLSRAFTRQAYQRSVIEGVPSASAGFKLAQEVGTQLGVVIYRAVYRDPNTLPSDRSRAAMGAVFLALRMDDALSAVLKDMPHFLRACLIDTTETPTQVLSGNAECRSRLAEGNAANASSHQTTVALPFAQRQWALQLWSVETIPVAGGRATSWLFAIGGVAFAASLGALLLVVTGTAERMAEAMDEASEQRQAAVLANQAKSEFLSRMSHELRTPLNAMLGFAQVMNLDRTQPLHDSQRARLDQIQHAGWHLLDMIDDVLDLSRIDTGTLRLQADPLHLQSVLTLTQPLIEELARKHRVSLTVDGTLPLGVGVLADETRLRQVLTNLMSNAVKYNRPGGSVRVQAASFKQEGQSWVRVVVSDTGLGMDEDQLAQLFQPFNRLGRERTQPDGTGIGLVISRHLTQLMGGQLDVSSREGEGSTFTLTLPTAQLPVAPEPEKAQTPFFPPERPAGQTGRNHVLYVEDNMANTALVQAALSSRPWIDLQLAATIEEGLGALHDRIRAPLPQVILLDVHLPDASGLDFLKLAKANPETRHIPVIMISADATPEQVDACLSAGAACYLTKPVQILALLQQIDDLLKA